MSAFTPPVNLLLAELNRGIHFTKYLGEVRQIQDEQGPGKQEGEKTLHELGSSARRPEWG